MSQENNENEIIPIIDFNPNPKCKDTRLTGDCIIRAICKITGFEWVDVYNRLCKRGMEMGSMPNSVHVIAEEFKDIFKCITCNINRNETVKEFILTHRIGSYIIITKRHALAVIDGIIYDAAGNNTILTEPGANKKVYKYFMLKNEEERN